MDAIEITPKSNKLSDLQEYIAELSSVVRDKQPKSAKKLFDRLLVESVGDKASRVLEYIPCKLDAQSVLKLLEKTANFQYFGFFAHGKYYTTAREVLNWGGTIKEMLKLVDFTNYKVFKCETPYFMYGQLSTHNQLTTVSHSQRYSECDRGYWKPPEIMMLQDNWDKLVGKRARPNELVQFMKVSGVKRREVFERGKDMLQNRVFSIGGYTNNPNAWEHFIAQRTDSHTQLETREFVEMLNV